MTSCLPETGFVRLRTLLGDSKAKPPIPAIVPVGKTTLYYWVKVGKFPKPTRELGPGITAWAAEDIRLWIQQVSLKAEAA